MFCYLSLLAFTGYMAPLGTLLRYSQAILENKTVQFMSIVFL